LAQEYEMISHGEMNFKLFLVNMLYRTPHIHKDFELCLIINGNISVTISNAAYHLRKGDFFIIGPFQSHELKADVPALILSMQVNASFFSSCYPQMANLEFITNILPEDTSSAVYREMYADSLDIARMYFAETDKFELKCTGMLNLLFAAILEALPYRIVSDKERSLSQQRASRMREIIHYMDEHYSEKLLLSDFAEKSGLSLTYLSHFFKNYMGISFQEYLLRIRCEKARQLLLLMSHSLLDISIECGFSDPKYFNADFRKQYGCSPKVYRRTFNQDALPQQQTSLLSTQEFLSREAALVLLK
jgi:AraC-like DNA-binding protein